MPRLPRTAARPQAAVSDPAAYPWTPIRENTLLTANAAWPLAYRAEVDEYDFDPQVRTTWTIDRGDGTTGLDDVLAALGAPGLAERRPVLAIGSNRSAEALRRKFGPDATWAIPVLNADVEGVYVGYAACVSRPGWVPWAPVCLDSDARHAWPVLMLTDEEIRRLDETEPNYARLPLSGQHRVFLDSEEELLDVALYRSRHGLIAGPDGTPVHAQDQAVGLALVERALGRLIDAEDLAADADLREAARLALAEHAVDDGFDTGGYDTRQVIGTAATVEHHEAAAAREAARLASRTRTDRLADGLRAAGDRTHRHLVRTAARLVGGSVDRLQRTLRTRIDVTGPVDRAYIERLCREELSPLMNDGLKHLPGAETVYNPYPDRLADLPDYLTWLRYSGGVGWQLVGEPGAETVDRHPARMTIYLTTAYYPGRGRAEAVQRLHARCALGLAGELAGTKMAYRFSQRIGMRRLGGHRFRPVPSDAGRLLAAVAERAAQRAATQAALDDLFGTAPTQPPALAEVPRV